MVKKMKRPKNIVIKANVPASHLTVVEALYSTKDRDRLEGIMAFNRVGTALAAVQQAVDALRRVASDDGDLKIVIAGLEGALRPAVEWYWKRVA